MGSAKRLRKLYEKPKKLWDAQRISEERKLLADYGLKNMRELWRIKTILRKVRREARSLLAHRGTGTETRKKQLLDRIKRLLINKQDISLDDVLSLSTRDILERRLQTVVQRKGFANTMAQARQFVSHGHVSIDGQKNTSPSRMVTFSEERQVGWYGHAIKANEEPSPEPAAPAPAEANAAKPESKQENGQAESKQATHAEKEGKHEVHKEKHDKKQAEKIEEEVKEPQPAAQPSPEGAPLAA